MMCLFLPFESQPQATNMKKSPASFVEVTLLRSLLTCRPVSFFSLASFPHFPFSLLVAAGTTFFALGMKLLRHDVVVCCFEIPFCEPGEEILVEFYISY
jgi:hypothetical protein